MNHSEESTTQGSTPNSTVLKLDQPSLASSLGVWDLRSDQMATMDIGEDPVKFREAPRLPSTAANRPPVVIASMPRSQDKWELHRAEISALYENLPLQTRADKPSVMSIMETRHSFFATYALNVLIMLFPKLTCRLKSKTIQRPLFQMGPGQEECQSQGNECNPPNSGEEKAAWR